MQTTPLQTTHQVAKELGAAPMKSILSGMASRAMRLKTGSGPNVNSKRSHFSNEAGIVFGSNANPTPRMEIDIQRKEKMEGRNQ